MLGRPIPQRLVHPPAVVKHSMYSDSTVHTFAYDDDHQTRFTYDPVGNRVTSFRSTSYLYDVANRLLEDDTFTYTYDANGNRSTKTTKSLPTQTRTYTYDIENQLIGLTVPGLTASYRYDRYLFYQFLTARSQIRQT